MTTTVSALWETMSSLRSRFSFRYSSTGRSAVCLVTDGRGFMYLEFWTLFGDSAGARAVPGARWPANTTPPGLVPTDAIPFDDGAVLVVAPDKLTVVEPDGTTRIAGRAPFRPAVLAPVPDGSRRVLLLGRPDPDDDRCAAWLWTGEDEPRRNPHTLPALVLRGGGWADSAGSGYIVNTRLGRRCRPARYDLVTGACVPLAAPTSADSDTAWFTAHRTGAVLMASEYQGTHRLSLHRPGHTPVRLAAPDMLSGTVVPLAMHADGRWVTLHVRDGLHEELAVLDTETDAIRVLETPPGRGHGAVAWAEAAGGKPTMWSFSIGPGLPCRAVGYTGDDRHEILDDTAAGRYEGWAPATLTRFPGAEGEIEAIACGHQDWRTARQVVLALHGGPAASWTLKFSTLFQMFADEGVTVLALNPRGSTGYGDAFHRLIVGRWAGPDLADVLATARYVRRERGGREPAVYGASYGAYLALVAACADPRLWSRVAVVAPMLSPARLHAEAEEEVRAMIDRLGGRTPVDDELGDRDVLRLLPGLRARLMIVHGTADPTVPVTQSRRLVAELTALGREPGADFRYHEVPEGGHTPLDGSAELHRVMAAFLAGAE